MSRKQVRERLMQMLFQMDIQKDYSETARDAYAAVYMPESGRIEYFDTLYALIRDNLESIDAAIEECSDNWSVGRMARVDISILRLAAGEIIYIDGIPDSASANEAVNLAKKFGGDDSRKFVNGILGRLIQRKTSVGLEAGRRPDDAGFDEYTRYKEFIDEHIFDFLPEAVPESALLRESMAYSLKGGGKRVRPVLLLAACEFAGGDLKQALPYACAVEYIHTYSLIHDDLPAMDDDGFRRGLPSNHAVFGEAVAILAGDGLLSLAFEIMNRDILLCSDDPAALRQRARAAYEISKCAGCRGMVAGQTADIESENKSVSGEFLDYIHLNKTAALIVGAVKAGAYMGKADRDIITNLENYAKNLGLAFQVADDILDVSGEAEEIGKKSADMSKRKAAYPAVHGMERSKRRLKELTDGAVNFLKPYCGKAEFFARMAGSLAKRSK